MNKLSFAIEKFDLMQVSNSELMKVKLYIVSEGDNAHERPIPWSAIEQARPTLIGKPIVAKYNNITQNLEGHEPDEIAVGVILSDNDIFYETDEEGKRWLCAYGIIWIRYAKDVAFVLDRDKIENLSMEIIVVESGENDSIESFSFSGITLIGTTPAIEKARAELLSFSKVKEEIEHLMYNFQIPQIVKQNAQKGLLLKQSLPKGATAVNLSIAQQLISNDYASLELINNIYKFSQKAKNDTARYLLGSIECFEWIDNILNPEVKEQFSKEGGKDVFNGLTSNQLRDRLKSCLKDFKYSEGMYVYERYWIDDFNDSVVYVIDYEDNKYYQIPYTFKDDACQIDINTKSQVEETYKPASFAQKVEFSVGEKLGNSSAIDIKNKKEDAIMSGSWSDPGATALNKQLEASNHESCVKEFYLIIDGDTGGDLSINNVHYPHHKLQGEEMVVDRQGVIAAYDRLMAQHVKGEALTHIQKHRKELDLNANDNKEGDKVKKKEQMSAKLSEQKFTKEEKEFAKYAYVTSDDKNVYAIDKENGIMMSFPFSIEGEGDEVNYSIDFTKGKKAKMSVTVIEDDDDPDEDDVYMSLKEQFTSDENTLAVAQAALNDKEAEYNKSLADMELMKQQMRDMIGTDDNSMGMNNMIDQIKSMMNDIKTQNENMSAENQKLKDNETKRLDQEKMATIEYSLQEVSDVLPKEKMEELREEAKTFSMDNINAWVNKVKAEAFSFSKGKDNNGGIVRMGLPWGNLGGKQQDNGSIWNKIGE